MATCLPPAPAPDADADAAADPSLCWMLLLVFLRWPLAPPPVPPPSLECTVVWAIAATGGGGRDRRDMRLPPPPRVERMGWWLAAQEDMPTGFILVKEAMRVLQCWETKCKLGFNRLISLSPSKCRGSLFSCR